MLPTKDQPVAKGSLTKAALVDEVAHVTGLTKKRADIIVDTVFGNIAAALQQGEKVELRGFGSFRLRHREPRRGRNPRTGDGVDVPLRTAQVRPLLQARHGAEGADQPGAGTGRAAALVRVCRRRTAIPSVAVCPSDGSSAHAWIASASGVSGRLWPGSTSPGLTIDVRTPWSTSVRARLPVELPRLGGRADGPPARGHRGGAGARVQNTA